MIEMSESIKELATALSKAQAKVRAAVRGSENTESQTRYANLASVWTACREALTRNGLSVTQFPGEISGTFMSMTTMLMHSSGQWIRQPLSIPLNRLDAQEYGAAATYARRYALAAVVGICPEDDDEISTNAVFSLPPETQNPFLSGPIDKDQLTTLTILAHKIEVDDAALCEYFGVSELSKLPASQYLAAKCALEQKRSRIRRVV